MPEPRGSWAELWGKQFCADGGKARCCPKADVRDSGPSGFRSQKRTFKSGRADFDMATSAFEQHRRERGRSEEHTSELQSLMRISYAVFCLTKKKTQQIYNCNNIQ